MSPNSNGYKSKIFKFVNQQYQKISEKSLIAIRALKIAVEWGLQIVLHSAQMLVQTAQKIRSRITSKNEAGEGAENLSYSPQTPNQEITAKTQQQFNDTTETNQSRLDFKQTLSTPVTQKLTTENKQEELAELNYSQLEEFTQELRQELDVYKEKDQKPENSPNSIEKKVARTEAIESKEEDWIQNVNLKQEQSNLLVEETESIEEISWLEKAESKPTEAEETKQQENWLEEITGQAIELEPLEEKQLQERANLERKEEIIEQESEFQFENLEPITNETTEFETEKEETISQFEAGKEEPVSQFDRSETRQETETTNNYPEEEKAKVKNLALVPTRRQKKLIPKIKGYVSDLLYVGTKLAGKLGAGLQVIVEKATENIAEREKLANALEKGKIVFLDTSSYLLEKFGKYSGKIKTKIDNLDLKSIDINKSLNLGKEGKTNLELKSYLLSGIQSYIKDIDIVYKEIQSDPEQGNNEKRKISPDWLETKATTIGYVKQPLEVILTLLDRGLFWIEEILAVVWLWVRKIIAKIRQKE